MLSYVTLFYRSSTDPVVLHNSTPLCFSGPCDFQIIFGRDFLRKIGNQQDFQLDNTTAFNITVAMKNKHFYSNPFAALATIIDDTKDDIDDCFHSTQILESKYNKADIESVAPKQTHLTSPQRGKLQKVFSERTKLLSGKLGHYTHKKMHLELLPDAVPIHAKPYSIPRTQSTQSISRTWCSFSSGRNGMGLTNFYYSKKRINKFVWLVAFKN
jgi:hypothetical protein